MSSNDIFGRSWEEIRNMQQKKNASRPVDTSKPAKAPASEDDKRMLSEYGSIEALENAGLFGVADRLK